MPMWKRLNKRRKPEESRGGSLLVVAGRGRRILMKRKRLKRRKLERAEGGTFLRGARIGSVLNMKRTLVTIITQT
jgi:hypothetical protein